MKRFSDSEVEQVLQPLLETPSPQTSLFESEPLVRNFLRSTVAPLIEQIGLSHETDEAGNLITEAGEGHAPGLVIFCYAMTHPAGRMTKPYDASRSTTDDGEVHLRGRGASEQKGALAAALLALSQIAERRNELGGTFTLCVSPSGETGRHDAAEAFLDHRRNLPAPSACLVGIGTNNDICTANKGRIDATIRVYGRAGHSAMPWMSRNAIEGARQVLRRLDDIHLPGTHPRLGSPTLTPTSLRSSPEATHTIPDCVEIVVDRRLLPGDSPESALEDIQAALNEVDDWETELEPGPVMFPSDLPPDSPLVASLRSAFAAAGRPEVALTSSHGCIDAGVFTRNGIPAVMLGPGDQAMWHSDEESVSLQDIALCADVYARTAFGLLGHPPSQEIVSGGKGG